MEKDALSIIINACAGVCIKEQQVLLTSRPLGKAYAGYWEFPGGKLEPGETADEALIRELREEIDIIVDKQHLQNLAMIEHIYPYGLVRLAVFIVDTWHGLISACENQKLFWLPLFDYNLPTNVLPTTEAIFSHLRNDCSHVKSCKRTTTTF